ncbi:MAG: hypothetical protein M0P11_03875 [Anaerolineaceae bacterium]|nr:hypothetical protein [Anaerolineaceae bacterium]
MSAPALILLARVVRDLLPHPEELIKIGREGIVRGQFDKDYIAIDSLAPAQPLARGKSYDGVAEKLTISSRMRQAVTLDFYGLNAYTNAEKLQLLLKSDKALDLQEQHVITVGAVSQVTDVKALTGQQYGNRVQVELTIQYSPSVVLDVLRIDVAVVEVLSN